LISFISVNFKNELMKDVSMFSPGTYAYDPVFRSYQYDPEVPKNWPRRVTRMTPDKFRHYAVWLRRLWEKRIQRDLKKVGLDAQLNKIEWQSCLTKWLAGEPKDLDMNEMGWGMATPWCMGMTTRCDHQPPYGFNAG
jgi:hypothetical protein